MARMKLKMKKRDESGTRQSVKLRSDGFVPGVVYGKTKENVLVKVLMKDINEVKGGKIRENALIDIVISGEGDDLEKTVLVKEIQKDPIKGDWIHVDLNEISLSEKIKTMVHLQVKGEAVGITQGGILEHLMHEIEIECLPTDLPGHLDIDVTNLEIGHTLSVKDIIVPEGVTILTDREKPIISVAVPKTEEEVVAPVEGEEGATEPEVIGKGKKEEEGEGEAEGEAKKEQKG